MEKRKMKIRSLNSAVVIRQGGTNEHALPLKKRNNPWRGPSTVNYICGAPAK
jgi:hypothetical protein